MPDRLIFSQIIGVLVMAYLAGLLIVARRLRFVHNEIWVSLGSPSLFHWSISNSFRLGKYVFFSGAFGRLNDTVLNWLVIATRMVALIVIGAIAVWIGYYHGEYGAVR